LPAAFPGDPADRLIVATALIEGATLVTRDGRIRRSALVETVWA
jgi:PIN domain nuclease of toxin-antitoxin system